MPHPRKAGRLLAADADALLDLFDGGKDAACLVGEPLASSASSMRRVVRVSSDVCSFSSSRDSARLTPDLVWPRCTAAALSEPLSRAVTKVFRSSELMSIGTLWV